MCSVCSRFKQAFTPQSCHCVETLSCSVTQRSSGSLQSSELPWRWSANQISGDKRTSALHRTAAARFASFTRLLLLIRSEVFACEQTDEILIRFSWGKKSRDQTLEERESDEDELEHVFSQIQMCWQLIFHHVRGGTCCSCARSSVLTSHYEEI